MTRIKPNMLCRNLAGLRPGEALLLLPCGIVDYLEGAADVRVQIG